MLFPTFSHYVAEFWKSHEAMANSELGRNGQFDEVPYIEWEKIKRRIAAWGYPENEALYPTIIAYEQATGNNFWKECTGG